MYYKLQLDPVCFESCNLGDMLICVSSFWICEFMNKMLELSVALGVASELWVIMYGGVSMMEESNCGKYSNMRGDGAATCGCIWSVLLLTWKDGCNWATTSHFTYFFRTILVCNVEKFWLSKKKGIGDNVMEVAYFRCF